MKRLIFILLAISAAVIGYADKWSPPVPRVYTSPSGRLVLKVFPSDRQKGTDSLAVILQLGNDGVSYTKKREFPLVNQWSPVEAFISDEAEVFTFDDWGMMGRKHAVVWYASDGKRRSEYSLTQLFPEKQLSEIREKHQSVSSIHWRGGKPRMNGRDLIIPDVLGGHISITRGVPEYIQKETNETSAKQ